MTLKARLINRSSIEVVDWDKEETRIQEVYECAKQLAGLTESRIEAIQSMKLEEMDATDTKEWETFVKIENDHDKNIEWLYQFAPYKPNPRPELEALRAILPVYELIDGAIVQKWESAGADMHRVAARIKSLKQQLAGSDYKIIKISEMIMTGQPKPSETEAIIRERQGCRDEINVLNEFVRKS
jgi:hypothetical protein